MEKRWNQKAATWIIFSFSVFVLLNLKSHSTLNNFKRNLRQPTESVAVVGEELPERSLTSNSGQAPLDEQVEPNDGTESSPKTISVLEDKNIQPPEAEEQKDTEDDIESSSSNTEKDENTNHANGSVQDNAKEQAKDDNESSSTETDEVESVGPSKQEDQPSLVDEKNSKTLQAPTADETPAGVPPNESTAENQSVVANDTVVARQKRDYNEPPDAPVINEQIVEENRHQAYLKFGVPKDPPFLDSSVPFANFSHIKFYGQAGLGHRLVRHAAAMYQGRIRGLAVRGFWSKPVYDFHDNITGAIGKRDLFSEMFEPFTREDFTYVNSTNRYASMYNEVPGADGIGRGKVSRQLKQREGLMKKVGKSGLLEGKDCECTYNEFQVYYDFFVALRDKYRKRQIVEAFREKHRFGGHTVIGIHLRAGNGETGDFERKSRGIKYDPTTFLESVVEAMLRNFGFNITTCVSSSPRFDFEKYPPMIFLATDDPAYRGHFDTVVTELQQRCSSSEIAKDSQHGSSLANISWPIVTLDQQFRDTGVVLNAVAGDDSLQEWHSMFQDALILGSSDVVIAATRSSFSQALPAILAMGRPSNERKTGKNGNQFCEVIDVTPGKEVGKNGTKPDLQMNCHDQLMKWCCQTSKLVHSNVWKFHKPAFRGTAEPHLELTPFEPWNHLSFEHTARSPDSQ